MFLKASVWVEPQCGWSQQAYRSEAVAVQTVAVMIPLDPEVTVGDSDVSVLVAQSPEETQQGQVHLMHGSTIWEPR